MTTHQLAPRGLAAALICCAAAAAACSEKSPSAGSTSGQTPAATATSATPAPAPAPPPAPAPFDSTAPDTFRVRFETSRGPVVVEVYRSWAPRGADRLHHLVAAHYFDNVRFHRVLLSDGVAQFGINGDTAVTAAWVTRVILDDPVTQSNARGTLTFAMRGPNTRNFQLFFNRTDNRRLDIQGFAPVGKVISGMAAVDSLYAGYGDGPPGGSDGPNQRDIASQGNAYLLKEFPKLDYIKTARFVNP